MFKSVEELQQFGKSQIEAATASAATLSRGFHQMAAETSAFARQSVEEGSAATTRLMGSKSLDGAAQVQADYAKTAMAGLVAQAGRMGSLMMSVGKDATRPFQAAAPVDPAGKR